MFYSRTKRDAQRRGRRDHLGYEAITPKDDTPQYELITRRDGTKVAAPTSYPMNDARHAANPATWAGYSRNANYSLSGLGSTRQFKAHPNKYFPMAAAIWQESPASADRAAKDALRALAKSKKSETGAAKSL
jgi:hypothetical protein